MQTVCWRFLFVKSESIQMFTHSFLACHSLPGIKDENEPGLKGVEVKLWNHKTKEFTKHESVESNSDRMVKFIRGPKGQPIHAIATKAPLGAIDTCVG